jgi:hypothetical protein
MLSDLSKLQKELINIPVCSFAFLSFWYLFDESKNLFVFSLERNIFASLAKATRT